MSLLRGQVLSCCKSSIPCNIPPCHLPWNCPRNQQLFPWFTDLLCAGSLRCAVSMTWNAVASFSTFSHCACSLRLRSKCHLLHKTSQISFFASWPDHKSSCIALSPNPQHFAPNGLRAYQGFLDFNKIFFDLYKWRE